MALTFTASVSTFLCHKELLEKEVLDGSDSTLHWG